MRPNPTSSRRRRGALLAGGSALAVAAAAGIVYTAMPSSAATDLATGAAASGRTFGAAVQAVNLADQEYVDILNAQFSSISPENDMKWEVTEPQPGVFDFDAADAIIAHAEENGMIVRGHVLVWHNQLPAYVQQITDPAEMQEAMERHITEVGGHFAGLEYMDVVNEAFDEDGTRRDNSPFQQVLGDGYIEDAFELAREVDPTGQLCYNDFNIEGINAKSDAVFEMVADFKARGVPIDCVGLQSHFIVGQVPDTLQENIQRFADLGVKVQISELDIRIQLPSDEAELAQQAADYTEVIEACLAVAGCTNITVWQVSDAESWVPSTFAGEGDALLFDLNRQPKPALDATLAALDGPAVPSVNAGG